MRVSRSLSSWALAALLAATCGCGRAGPKEVPVTGRVTCDGYPLAGGTVGQHTHEPVRHEQAGELLVEGGGVAGDHDLGGRLERPEKGAQHLRERVGRLARRW